MTTPDNYWADGDKRIAIVMALYGCCGFFSFLARIIYCFAKKQYPTLMKYNLPISITYKNGKEKYTPPVRNDSLSEYAKKIMPNSPVGATK